MYRRLLLGVLCVLCATKLEGVVFQNISNAEDSLKAVRDFQPFSSQTCLVKVKQPNGKFEGRTGILMDSQHVLVSGFSVMEPEKITVRQVISALEETESSTTPPGGSLLVQEVFLLATPSKVSWDCDVKLAERLGNRRGKAVFFRDREMDCVSSSLHLRFGVHVGPNLALLRLKVPVKAVSLWDRIATKYWEMVNPTVLTLAARAYGMDEPKRRDEEEATRSSEWRLHAVAQPPWRSAGLLPSRRFWYIMTYTLSEDDRFVLSAEEKACAPQHFGMLLENGFGGILLGTVKGETCLLGCVDALVKTDVKKAQQPSAAEVPSAASLEMPLEAPLEASAAKDLGKRREAHWLCEAVTHQSKSLLQDIAAGRVTKEKISDAWAAL